MLGYKTTLNKFNEIKIIQSIFSDHNGMKLEVDNSKKMGRLTNTWKPNNTLLNNLWMNEDI